MASSDYVSGFWIRNMDFPKFAIVRELLVITTPNDSMEDYSTSNKLEIQILESHSGSYFSILELEHGFP